MDDHTTDASRPAQPRWTDRPRIALLVSLAIWWANYFSTARWKDIPGSIHGPKQWLFLALLTASTALVAFRRARPTNVGSRTEARIGAILAAAGLLACFAIWFPPATWTQIPFLDNWPARFQSTVDGIALLKRGAFVGWQWAFLGGYHTSSDLTVTLTVPALLPMLLFGDRVGFHLAHLILFSLLPILVWFDFGIAQEDEEPAIAAALPALAFTLVCATTAGFSYFLLRSGDTNSLAGVAASLIALVGSHASAKGRRAGPWMLVGGLVLVTYCHAGFFLYVSLLLLAEAAYYRDRARLWRSGAAIAAGVVAGLPLTFESWRYPSLFIFNNVLYEPVQHIPWLKVARKVYYNVEILFAPGRWFNDFTSLATIFAPLIVVMVVGRRSRAGYYAAGSLVIMALLRLNVPEFGYAFLRPVHMLAVLVPPVIAAFLLRHVRDRLTVSALTVTLLVFLQVLARPVPHVESLEGWQPALVAAVRASDGNLVLVENTYHRDMIVAEGQESEGTPFPANFQGLLPTVTGQRLYAGVWDGWQWSPYRSLLVAGGAWRGRAIGDWPTAVFLDELHRWGIRHLFVVHEPTKRYLSDAAFVRMPDAGLYAHYVLADADPRSVVTSSGSGRLVEWDPLGGMVALDGVRAGTHVVVRTHWHPAWQAEVEGTGAAVPLRADNQQLAFDAPKDGSYHVRLVYPARRGLLVLAVAAIVIGLWAVRRVQI